MTDAQFKEIKDQLEVTNTIIFAGFTALIQKMNPELDAQEAADAIISCLTPAMEEVRGILDESKGR